MQASFTNEEAERAHFQCFLLSYVFLIGVWKQIIEKLNESRIDQKLPPLLHNGES